MLCGNLSLASSSISNFRISRSRSTSQPLRVTCLSFREIGNTRRAWFFSAAALGLSVAAAQFVTGPKAASKPRMFQFEAMTGHRDQKSLISSLVHYGVIKDGEVAKAMTAVDRKYFVAPHTPNYATYADEPLPIGHHQTISAPHMHATALSVLSDHIRKPGSKVLDVGSGSGYLAAAMGVMVGEGGHVLGIEKYPELAERSVQSVRRAVPGLMERGVVRLQAGNVLGDALQGEGPFDAIHVGAAASTLPQILVEKLNRGGRMVIPVDRDGPFEGQVFECVDKDDNGKVTRTDLMGVRYVPLTPPGVGDEL